MFRATQTMHQRVLPLQPRNARSPNGAVVRFQDRLTLRFEQEIRFMSAAQALAIKLWARRAHDHFGHGVVVMAAERSMPDAVRIARLREVRELVVESGFAPERVRYAIEPLPGRSDLARPDDDPILMLRVLGGRQAEMEVRSICSLLGAVAKEGSRACTNDS